MSTLLIHLCGPMQAWGTQSRFSIRDTGQEPSKSGVIGLLCAALGKPRDENPGDGFPTLAQLAALKMGVRVDRPGSMRMDYQTAGGTHRLGDTYGVAKADGSRPGPVTSHRYYLTDAEFLIGLESTQSHLMERLDAALADPKWQLFLGRKSFVPSVPVRPSEAPPWGPALRDQTLEQALGAYPWLGDLRARSYESRPSQLLLITDSDDSSGEVRRDLPLCFSPRRFALRYVKTQSIQTPTRETL